MPLVHNPQRSPTGEQATTRFFSIFADRVVAKCALTAWVVYVLALFRLHAIIQGVGRAVRSRLLQRRFVCFVIVINLLLWPGPGLAAR